MLKYILFFLFLISASSGFTWCANGHKVIGQIAYDYLNPSVKRKFAHLNQCLNRSHKHYSLVGATVWMDTLYEPRYLAFKPMHYIDIPYSTDGLSAPLPSKMNAILAVQQATQTLQNSASTELDRAIALRIILHVAGDIHQPLHAVTRVTKSHPKGDRGGNDFHLGKNAVAPNLHRYWDRGGGLLSPKMKTADVKYLAKKIESQWVCPLENSNINHWVSESHALAIKYAYSIQEGDIPSELYEKNTQTITQQQLAYAGCRLAALLNRLSTHVIFAKNE